MDLLCNVFDLRGQQIDVGGQLITVPADGLLRDAAPDVAARLLDGVDWVQNPIPHVQRPKMRRIIGAALVAPSAASPAPLDVLGLGPSVIESPSSIEPPKVSVTHSTGKKHKRPGEEK